MLLQRVTANGGSIQWRH